MGEVLTKEQVLAAGTHPGRTPCYEMDLSEYVGQSIGEDTPKHVMFFKSPEAIGGGIAYGYYEQRGGWIVNPNLRGAAFKLIRRIQEQAAVTTKTFMAQRDKINGLEQQLKAASQEFYIIQAGGEQFVTYALTDYLIQAFNDHRISITRIRPGLGIEEKDVLKDGKWVAMPELTGAEVL